MMEAPETEAPPAEDAPDPIQAPARTLPAHLAAGSGRLAEAVSDFNRFPTRYAHASWWPKGWNDGPAGLAGDGGRAETRMGEILLRRWGLDARPCFGFDALPGRLALVDPEPLNRLVLLAGLARHAEEISRILERTRVQAIRRQLGEEAYAFAVFRAPLIAGTLGIGSPGTVAPDMGTRAVATGLGMLAACWQGGRASVSRLALKFPRAYTRFLAPTGDGRSAEAFARLFRKILIQEVDPAWDSLISSAA